MAEGCKSWLVAIICSTANCILMCPYRLSGLIFVLLLEKYGTDREKASMPIFMFFLMVGLIGPLSGWIAHKIGEEVTTLIGSFIAAVGFGMTYFAANITTAIVYLGLIYGFGMSMGVTLIPNILKKHFTKNYHTASGISNSGPCIGALIFPPIAVLILNTYGVSGTFLIIGGLMLHGVPIAMLLRSACPNNPHKASLTPNENISADVEHTAKRNIYIDNSSSANSKENVQIEEDIYIGVDKRKCGETNILEIDFRETNDKNIGKSIEMSSNNIAKDENLMKENGFLSNKKWHSKTKTSFYSFMRLFKDRSFLVLMVLVSLLSYVATLVWTTMIDYSRDKKIATKYEVYLLMFPSLFDMIGRLGLTWIVDKKYMSSITFTIIMNFMLAMSSGVMIVARNVTVLMSGALLFGLCTGALLAINPGLIFEFMEKEYYIMAMSSRMLLYVPLSFTAAPLIEYFRTDLQSYDGLYILVIAICLLCCCIAPLASRYSVVKNK